MYQISLIEKYFGLTIDSNPPWKIAAAHLSRNLFWRQCKRHQDTLPKAGDFGLCFLELRGDLLLLKFWNSPPKSFRPPNLLFLGLKWSRWAAIGTAGISRLPLLLPPVADEGCQLLLCFVGTGDSDLDKKKKS